MNKYTIKASALLINIFFFLRRNLLPLETKHVKCLGLSSIRQKKKVFSSAKCSMIVQCGESFWSITGGEQQQKTVFRSAAEMSVHHKSFVCPLSPPSNIITLCALALITLSNGARCYKRDRNCPSSAIMTHPGPHVKTWNRHMIICLAMGGLCVCVCGWVGGGRGGLRGRRGYS